MEEAINRRRCSYSKLTAHRSRIWTIVLVIIVVLVFGSSIETAMAGCPHLCECKWKQGKNEEFKNIEKYTHPTT